MSFLYDQIDVPAQSVTTFTPTLLDFSLSTDQALTAHVGFAFDSPIGEFRNATLELFGTAGTSCLIKGANVTLLDFEPKGDFENLFAPLFLPHQNYDVYISANPSTVIHLTMETVPEPSALLLAIFAIVLFTTRIISAIIQREGRKIKI